MALTESLPPATIHSRGEAIAFDRNKIGRDRV
jgi:hypothetical protein